MALDENSIVAATVTELTKTFFYELKKSSVDFFSKKYVYLFEDFSNYIDVTFNRCNYVRTIINKDKSFELSEIYVPTFFRIGDETISDNDLIQIVRDGTPVVVQGFGGIGKTVFTKSLWLSIYREPKGKIPVYLEVRKLNNLTDADIITYIRRTISPKKTGVDEDVFNDFLRDGRFIFIFDGFDEISDAKKSDIGDQIVSLAYDFPENGYVVSSRHDDRFFSWQRFEVYKACAFNKSQVIELLSRIPYDRDTKKKFSTEILEKKYDSYETFLSTPLLPLMMLMTFSQFAEVPDKRHIFYRYAFMTLYSWHDSSKESFNREKQTGLLLDQFEQAFSTFCLISYLGRDIEFDDRKITDYINRVKKYVSFDFDENLFLLEITDAVNLLYRDGDKYQFTHRSFQEYFSAYAAVNYFQHKMIDLIPRIYSGSDIVLGLMYEINKDVVDENYIMALYDKHKKEISDLIANKDWREFSDAIKFRYVAGFTADKKRLVINMFGTDVRTETWSYVHHLSAFFETSAELKAVGGVDRFNHSMVSGLEKVVRSHLKAGTEGGALAIYTPCRQELQLAMGRKPGYQSYEEDIVELASSGKIIPAKSKELLVHAEQDAQKIKALYVSIDKSLKITKRNHTRKEKGIDELLL